MSEVLYHLDKHDMLALGCQQYIQCTNWQSMPYELNISRNQDALQAAYLPAIIPCCNDAHGSCLA